MSVATNMLQKAESDENFMGQIITGDETWVYGYDPETKRLVFAVEVCLFPEAKESAPGAVKNENHAYCFL